jgi:hypothetical protein
MDSKRALTTPRIILVVLLGAVLLALIFSGRPWRGYSMPRVAEIAVLEDRLRHLSLYRRTEARAGRHARAAEARFCLS